MKPLDREPSNSAEPQQLLGDCATLGNHRSAELQASVEHSSRDEIESDLGSRVYINEWTSHLTKAVGARSKEAQQVRSTVMQQCTIHRGGCTCPAAVRASGILPARKT